MAKMSATYLTILLGAMPLLTVCRESGQTSQTSAQDQSSENSQQAIAKAAMPKAPSCPNSAAYKIVGGETVAADDLATASTLKIWVRNQRFCTGTLIGPEHLVTAAHCLKDVKSPDELRLGFGTQGTVIDALKVTAFRLHPQFTSISADSNGIREQAFNDVAVIKFKGNLQKGMVPVALAQPENIGAGMPVILSGYGAYNTGDRQLRPLSTARLQLASLRSDIRELQLESGTGKGACFGDSGGPTFIQGEGGSCLFLVGSTTGPGRNTDLSCEAGGGTLMDLTRYQGWISCTFEEIGARSLGLVADSSSEACQESPTH